MDGKIKQKLELIEKGEEVKVLFVCESGSRAWGFASPDSDFDVRFIYTPKEDWYLSIFEGRDVIEYPLDEDNLDVSGWNLRKTLQLLYKSNPPLLEWLQSPIIYSQLPGFKESLADLGEQYFSAKSAGYHYLSIVKGNYKDYFKAEKVKLKKYFYVLRSLFAAQFVIKNKRVPPMEFKLLLDGQRDESLKEAIHELLKQKEQTTELGVGERIPLLDKFIESNLESLEKDLEKIEVNKNKDLSALDEFFRYVLRN